MGDILGRRALSAGRLAALGATLDFHHGLLRYEHQFVAGSWTLESTGMHELRLPTERDSEDLSRLRLTAPEGSPEAFTESPDNVRASVDVSRRRPWSGR
jgi:hypothetical protein